MDRRIAGYFDAAAGVPLHPVAYEAMQAAQDDGWADPGRLTGPGRRSAVLLDAAREAVASTFDVHADEVSFVPSGVHALHIAVLGMLAGRSRTGNRLVHSAVEHSAVLEAARWHESHGGSAESIGVDSLGRVDVEKFVDAARKPGVAAAVLQAANHEVGTRQPVSEVATVLADGGVPLIVDTAHELVYGGPPADAPVFTADARLWGGPAGVGVLVVRRGTRWRAPFPSDEAEFGRSAGTVSVPAIVGAAAALRATRADLGEVEARLRRHIDRIRMAVPSLVGDSVVLGDPIDRLPHLVTFSCLYVEGEALLTELDRRGFAVSSGSSCTSDTLTPSHVLVAMGALTSGNIRVSLHADVTDEEVERFLHVVPEAVAEVRAQLPSSTVRATSSPELQSAPEIEVDSRGRRCPLPILDLARALPQLPLQAELTVLADDPAAASDVAAWCRMRGQQLVAVSPIGDGATAFRIRRLR